MDGKRGQYNITHHLLPPVHVQGLGVMFKICSPRAVIEIRIVR